jgi:DNA invertase Pin-like site-specific DNA recombinase
MKRQSNNPKKVYLYGRLSHEDETTGDSNSIVNQRKMLTKYAEENGFTNFEFVFDDGYSGANWERPAFTKMIEEVEAGTVSAIICKDLSRFGRGHLQVGFHTEILFPKHDVRFIAIHDNVDSEQEENELAPMVNLFNEWFLKSTSKKIRAVCQAKGKSGRATAFTLEKHGKITKGDAKWK